MLSGQSGFRRWSMWRHSASEICHGFCEAGVCIQRGVAMENQHLRYSCGSNCNKKSIHTPYSVRTAVFVKGCVAEGDRK